VTARRARQKGVLVKELHRKVALRSRKCGRRLRRRRAYQNAEERVRITFVLQPGVRPIATGPYSLFGRCCSCSPSCL